jgi:ribosomal protein L3 glutamine methyltransferase
VTPDEKRRVDSLVAARIRTRKPAAYLTGEAWLGEYRFYVDERVLVPRSYIAELLRDDLRPWIAPGRPVRRVLDLCTGSGCLAIMAARSFPHAHVDAADLSTDALDVARINIARYRLTRRVEPIASDLFSALRGRRYDLIISNPPYVREAVMTRLPAEYRREPRIALAGGSDGLDLVRRIVGQAPLHLQPGGSLVLEVGHNRKRVERAFASLPFVWPETSGGDDCVCLITREALPGSQAGLGPATRAAASPRRPAAKSPARVSSAAAARRRRTARG